MSDAWHGGADDEDAAVLPSPVLCLHSGGEALDLHLLGTHGTCGYAGFPRHHL